MNLDQETQALITNPTFVKQQSTVSRGSTKFQQTAANKRLILEEDEMNSSNNNSTYNNPSASKDIVTCCDTVHSTDLIENITQQRNSIIESFNSSMQNVNKKLSNTPRVNTIQPKLSGSNLSNYSNRIIDFGVATSKQTDNIMNMKLDYSSTTQKQFNCITEIESVKVNAVNYLNTLKRCLNELMGY